MPTATRSDQFYCETLPIKFLCFYPVSLLTTDWTVPKLMLFVTPIFPGSGFFFVLSRRKPSQWWNLSGLLLGNALQFLFFVHYCRFLTCFSESVQLIVVEAVKGSMRLLKINFLMRFEDYLGKSAIFNACAIPFRYFTIPTL